MGTRQEARYLHIFTFIFASYPWHLGPFCFVIDSTWWGSKGQAHAIILKKNNTCLKTNVFTFGFLKNLKTAIQSVWKFFSFLPKGVEEVVRDPWDRPTHRMRGPLNTGKSAQDHRDAQEHPQPIFPGAPTKAPRENRMRLGCVLFLEVFLVVMSWYFRDS